MRIVSIFIGGILLLAACGQPSVKNPAVTPDTIIAESATKPIVTKVDTIINDGEKTVYYDDGAIKMRGMMKNGKRDGIWRSWYPTGVQWSETTFMEGKKEGKTTTWYENAQKRYDGYYSNDAESGRWVYWNEQGKFVSAQDYGKK